jgi:hypothetical protein
MSNGTIGKVPRGIKRVAALALMSAVVVWSGLAAEGQDAPKLARGSFYAGAGLEFSMNSLRYYALSETAALTYDMNDYMAWGFRITTSQNLRHTAVYEPEMYFRVYLLKFWWGDIFTQWDMGASFIVDDKTLYPELLMGVVGGVRIPFLGRFYAEPFVRFGYPYMWGIGATGGIRF